MEREQGIEGRNKRVRKELKMVDANTHIIVPKLFLGHL